MNRGDHRPMRARCRTMWLSVALAAVVQTSIPNASFADKAPDPALLEFLGMQVAAEAAGVDVGELIDDRLDVQEARIRGRDQDRTGQRVDDDMSNAEQQE